MRSFICGLVAALLLAAPASAAPPMFSSPERISARMNAYRAQPEPARIPAAVQAMKELNLFREQDAAGFLIGFLAGVLGQNEGKAERLVTAMFPMPPKEQAVIVKAIAYSGLPNRKALLTRVAARMLERKPLIDDYLSGKAPTLMNAPLDEGPHIVHTLWGYYVATGQQGPVARVMSGLRWTKPKNEGFSLARVASAVGWGEEVGLEKLAVGSTAKWTLVFHAERDRSLLEVYRAQLEHQPEEIAAPLKEVVEASEAFEAERIRKEEAAAVQEEQQRLARNGSPLSRAAYAGSVALSGGCIVAGALGHPEIAVPCVITGVIYTGAQKLWQNAR